MFLRTMVISYVYFTSIMTKMERNIFLKYSKVIKIDAHEIYKCNDSSA